MVLAFGQDLPEERIGFYVNCIIDLPFKETMAAALHIIGLNTFFPTISELRKRTVKLLIHQVDAHDAWEEVRGKITGGSSTRERPYSIPLIQEAVNKLGWRSLCESTNQVADRAHFFKVYEALARMELEKRIITPMLETFEVPLNRSDIMGLLMAPELNKIE